MSLRVAALLAVLVMVASCMEDDRPLPSCPMPTATAPTATPSAIATGPIKSWRAVLVAGDNSSPAFDNGIGTLRDRLAAAGVRDIQTLSASGAGGSGRASADNLAGALRASAGGACLVYMTSHGSEAGFFLRPGLCLMGSAALDQALSEGCGDAPTVVVISACHSGAFLNDTMRRPNRIILTASAADRTSFGCGADNDYTYYDACFLQQLDSARTWQQMGVATRACVENLERQLKVPDGSQPQMFVGAGVSDLRLPGR
jgi:hypothetical protein